MARTKWSYGDAWKAERAAGRFREARGLLGRTHRLHREGARDLVTPVLRERPAGAGPERGTSGPRIVVYQSAAVETRRLRAASRSGPDVASPAWRLADGGPSTPVTVGRDELRFVARDVPADGLSHLRPCRQVEPAQACIVRPRRRHHRELRSSGSTLDPARGGVRSAGGQAHRAASWSTTRVRYGFGQYLYERFDADQVDAYCRRVREDESEYVGGPMFGKPVMPPAERSAPTAPPRRRISRLRFERSPASRRRP